ncbi:serglycin isoform X1 [Ochotona curzoniae]|uniref:serglycin isoform X1 n=1 Tax=Ochotona curzoniae TaxID=130825 RepID=UPI001B34DD13|nr:serglycin isoform X1 [Ochotona curzoniae]
MQKLLTCRILVLALALVLLLDSSAQGYPMRRARYQWVRCSPDSNSANCIEEKGPVFNLLPGDSNRILPPRTDPFFRIKSQNLNDAFPLSDDLSGSGFDSGSGLGSGSGSSLPSEMEREYQPLLEDDVFYYDIKALKQNLPSEDQEMGHAGPEDEFII